MIEETPANIPPPNNSNEYDPQATGQGIYWIKNEFDGALVDKGYPCLWEKAMQCPCRVKANGSALNNCINCNGSGWLYIDPIEIQALLQSMAYTNKYFQWSEADMGTGKLSVLGEHKIVFMDKVTMLDAITSYSQMLYPTNIRGKNKAFTVYKIKSIEFIFAFKDADSELIPLKQNKDFIFKDNEIEFKKEVQLNYAVCIRYSHHPTYLVYDIPRDMIVAPTTTSTDSFPKRRILPLTAIVKKLHFINN